MITATDQVLWSTDTGGLSVLYSGPTLQLSDNPHRVVIHSYDWNNGSSNFANTVSQ